MPKKPTQPFGSFVFSKDGKVRRNSSRLSEVKPTQEKEALERFLHTFNTFIAEAGIIKPRQLQENDHDFIVEASGVDVLLQLTELVDRTFTFPMSREQYMSGNWPACVHKGRGEIPWRLDIEKRDHGLTGLIAQKVAKNYSKARRVPLWLVVFATFHYDTEYMCDGKIQRSEALSKSRRYLTGLSKVAFDQIWFTNLQSRPVRIWPVPDDNGAVLPIVGADAPQAARP